MSSSHARDGSALIAALWDAAIREFSLCMASIDTCTMRAELIGHFEACMTEIYLHIDARVADYIRTHPYCSVCHF